MIAVDNYIIYKIAKVWYLEKGYCTQEQFDSIDPFAYDRTKEDDNEAYQKAKKDFYKDMFKYADEYNKEMIDNISKTMEKYPSNSIEYEGLLWMLDDYESNKFEKMR